MDQLEKDIWGIIQHMESVVGRDGLGGMTKKQLRELIIEVYTKLNEINRSLHKIERNHMRRYHYEWAAYTDNLNYGRLFIARDRDRGYVVWRASMANKGAYIVVKERVYE